MSDYNDFNQGVIQEFRANEGRVGGPFEGAPVVLLHHVGRKSGKEYVSPLMYLPDGCDPDSIYVFASKGGAPVHPEWYHNLVAAPNEVTIQDGPVPFDVTVREVSGAERAAWWERAVAAYPPYADYQVRTERLIPVLVATRVAP